MSAPVQFTVGNRTLNFRPPTLGNKDEISFQRINRQTRGGDLILFRDNQWPKTERLHLTFDFDTNARGLRLLQFIRDYIGLEMNYRDHENRLWVGIIANPETELVQTARHSFHIEVIFEGDQVV